MRSITRRNRENFLLSILEDRAVPALFSPLATITR